MNLYGLLEKLVTTSTMGEGDKKAAVELIRKIDGINGFGSAVRGIDIPAGPNHTHVKETHRDPQNATKLVDICRDCNEKLSEPYDPKWSGGNSTYFHR